MCQECDQRHWAERHPQYWREYRRAHPEYTERNRSQQRDRGRQRRANAAERVLANGDASRAISPLPSGTYELKPVARPGSAVLANEDVWHVEIAVLPRS